MQLTKMKIKFLALITLFLASQNANILMGQPIVSDEWNIVARNIDPSKYFGVTVANGMIGIVSSPNPMQVKDVVLNGAFDTYGRGRVSNIMKVFSFANMNLDVEMNGQSRRLGRADISDYQQTLDMKNAALATTFAYKDVLTVKHEVMALRQMPHTALINVEITAKKACTIIPASVIESPDNLKDVKNFYAEIDRPHIVIPLMTSVAKSPTGRLTLAVSNTFLFEEKHGSEPRVIHEEWDNNMHLLKFKKTLKAGETYRFSVIGSVISTAQSADPQNEAERMTIFAALEKKERILARHRQMWADLWQSDIVIEGDVAAQRAVHSALYHLYSFVREGTSYSLSPMGLSGLGYNGHVFWDTELWMFPPLLALHPEMAKSPMEYRFKGLEAAKNNAVSYGYKGAKYPWEGDDTGQEGTPVWALSGPFEHHITGCVGYAMWKYYQVTKDKKWLREKGFPVLKETADFWAARSELGKDGKYHIINVVCADEWAENVDDNAFTNGIAKEVMGYAQKAATELGEPLNPMWKTVADNMTILKFPDGTTREHATYNGEPIKQTDVNLLSYPLSIVTDEATIKKDLDYYWKTLGDNVPGMKGSSPAMAQAIFCILNARLNNTEVAYNQFQDSYKPNGVPPFDVLSETAGGTNPYFATGAGGFLQTLIFGFGGLEFNDDGIVQKYKPKLPKQWKSLTIKGVGLEKKTYVIKN
jgi:protein-glucosylgalactosylhydroxylysine glucosidase